MSPLDSCVIPFRFSDPSTGETTKNIRPAYSFSGCAGRSVNGDLPAAQTYANSGPTLARNRRQLTTELRRGLTNQHKLWLGYCEWISEALYSNLHIHAGLLRYPVSHTRISINMREHFFSAAQRCNLICLWCNGCPFAEHVRSGTRIISVCDIC